MNHWVFLAFSALSAVDVFCSHYHGPTTLPQVLHNDYLADTHDVAAAKSARQSHGYVNTHNSHGSELSHNGDLRYHGPTAIPHVLRNGHIADTHEVAAAKAEHLALVSQARAHNHVGDYRYAEEHHQSSGHGDLKYHGPTAVPHVLHNGHIADTHEVAAAKAEHLSLVSQARVHSHGGDYRYAEEHHQSSGHGDLRYHGPTAIPHVLHDGHIADTHEVAAAKAEHLALVYQAKAHVGHGYNNGGSSHGFAHQPSYHGPELNPVVLKSGYLADTHEVAAARQHHLQALHSRNSESHNHSY